MWLGECPLGFGKGQEGKRREKAIPTVGQALGSGWDSDPGGITDQLCKYDKPFTLGDLIF